MVTIRLSRGGAKKRPFLSLDGDRPQECARWRFIERVGFFNPMAQGQAERLRVDFERIDHWISLGAKTSDRVKRLLKDARQAA